MTDAARRHHYVPACYLRHFAIPTDRDEGVLHAYDRISSRAWQSSPDKSAHERDFYRVDVDGSSANSAENAYEALETRFAPTLADIVERGTLPSDSERARDELYAFVASQAVRTPRIREQQQRFYNDTAMLYMRTLANNKKAFMTTLRKSEPRVSDDEAEEAYATHLDFVARKGACMEIDQTTLVQDSLELGATVERVLAQRSWILGVAPDGVSFITSDDPVHLQPSQLDVPRIPFWSPGFGDQFTNVIVPLSPRFVLMGLPYEFTARARIRLSRHEVAAVNSDVALSAYRFVYSTQPTFAQIGKDGSVVAGPTSALALNAGPSSAAERLGFFTSPWPSRGR